MAAAVEEALKGWHSWREIIGVVDHGDDMLVDFDQLDAVWVDRAVWIAEVDGMGGKMLDRGLILNAQVSQLDHRVQTVNTCHSFGRKHCGDAARPANGGRFLGTFLPYAIEDECFRVRAQLV